jgi:NTE family protein
MKRAIVLSGGGSKGSYQMGVWKALRKLNIDYNIVTGTSVGSLNGALMAQNTYFRGVWFWHNIKEKHIFDEKLLPKKNEVVKKSSIFSKYAKEIFINRGLDVSNLENTIDSILDEYRFRHSKIDFGLVTFNLSNLRPITMTKKEIPKGKLKDYLMASATCFPAFKKKNIDDVNYIDGGYYDNLPINLAVDMGAEEVIAVDLRAIGIKRRVKDKNVKIIYIKPRNSLGFFLSFRKDLARRGMRLGFNDTMKTFDKLDGNKFTFEHKSLGKNYKKYKKTYLKTLNNLLAEDNKVLNLFLKLYLYKNNISESEFNNIVEFLGKIFNFDDSFIYDINKYNRLLIHNLNKIIYLDNKEIESQIKSKRNILDNKNVIKYLYEKISKCNNLKSKKELANLAVFLPHEFQAALYLYVIKKQYFI